MPCLNSLLRPSLACFCLWSATVAAEPLVEWSGRAIAEAEALRNTELRRGSKRINELAIEPTLRLNAHIRRDAALSGFVETELSREIERETGETPQKANKLSLNQAYVTLKPDTAWAQTRVRLGRWQLRDEREWLFDENIDGLLLEATRGRWSVQALGGRVNHWQRDLLDSSTKGNPVNTTAVLARYRLDKDWQLGTYAVAQRDLRTDRDRLLHLGLRSHADPDKRLRHWLEVATVRGREDGQSLRGYALDAGGTYVFHKAALRPRLTLGYAWGSGDGNASDGQRRYYRQSGLQSNEADFGGLTKYQVYGVALNPELRNLHILTAGVGLNLAPQLTLDMVYHRYTQHHLATLTRRSTELNPDTDILSTRRLGSGLDVVLGWRPRRDIKLEAAVGWFDPSARFRNGSSAQAQQSSSAYAAWVELGLGF